MASFIAHVPRGSLPSMPTEIVCHILSELDFESLLSFIRTNKRFHKLFTSNWAYILPAILETQFSPAEGLFRIFDDNLGPLILSPLQLSCRPGLLKRLIQLCHTIKEWEAIFPALRFSHQPGTVSRSLDMDENGRLRRALYTWWRFSNYFHTEGHATPEARFSFLRRLSTAELYELDDLWRTVQAAVEEQICPSAERVRLILGHDFASADVSKIAWGSGEENKRIAKTVVKLDPRDILHFLCSRHAYASKVSLIREIRVRHPSIESTTELLSWSLRSVIDERFRLLAEEKGRRAISRRRYFPPDLGFPRCSGGILDYPAERWEKLRTKFGDDGGDGAAHRIGRPLAMNRERFSQGQLMPIAG
ncbi:hypothetical protein GQ53DRAFT_802021 [Thozetella sp. PMI_491]|nr:hypothetical protein GQ53DRAFT_802021 [Thozetella sp. PMI_491]